MEVGQAYLFFGKETGWAKDTPLSSADASFYGENALDHAGCSVSPAGDVNGDGFDDILIGANGYSAGFGHVGRAYLIMGKAAGWNTNTSLSTADASFVGEAATDEFARAVAAAGDVNGDGFDDIIIGAPFHDGGPLNNGKTYLVFGRESGWVRNVPISTADASFIGKNEGDQSGTALARAGDVNADGYDDFLVGAPRNGEGGDRAGQAYLILGSSSGWSADTPLSNADASFLGEADNDLLGSSLAPGKDINHDGFDDILIGAPQAQSYLGKAYLIPGKSVGWARDTNITIAASDSFIGETIYDNAGSALAFGDVNGDGFHDLVIAANFNDENGSTAGQTYLILNELKVIYVNSAALGNNDGTSWADAFNHLQDALDMAASGDEIWVASGTYTPSATHGGTSPRHQSFQMKNGVEIYGGFPNTGSPAWEGRDWQSNATILSGDIGLIGDNSDNCYHVFYNTGPLDQTSVLDGFTITGGNANGNSDQRYGGGMYNGGSYPLLTNCTFRGNTADWGGGIYNNHSNPLLSNSIFWENTAVYYGGGGIYNYFSNPVIANCTFYDNTADDYGGGIYNQSSSPRLTNCILWENTAPLGTDEIHTSIGTPTATYCNIQGCYPGTGNICADPMFVNPQNGDFHLLPDSPCIDSGSNSAVQDAGITQDFDGDPRVINGRVDMGADELALWSPWFYDTNYNGKISYSEMIDALMDYLTGEISYSQMIDVLMLYLISA